MDVGVTQEQQARLDIASEHAYECRCKLCEEWWELMPPEEEEFESPDPDEPAF